MYLLFNTLSRSVISNQFTCTAVPVAATWCRCLRLIFMQAGRRYSQAPHLGDTLASTDPCQPKVLPHDTHGGLVASR